MSIFTDPVERIIAEALVRANVEFVSPCPTTNLDFKLAGDVWIECKQFYTERSHEQLRRSENVILIQGTQAALRFAALLGAGQ